MNRSLSLNQALKAGLVLVLMVLSSFSLASIRSSAVPYGLEYVLGYAGVPFSGGAISIVSNFTNTGQLTIRVTSISFASDFWSNGTRIVTAGFPFNLTAGVSRGIDTPVFIPASTPIGEHVVTGVASWQFSNSTGWYDASPVVVTRTVLVSRTIGSLFSSFATILLVGIGIVGLIAVLVVSIVVRQGKKPKPSPAPGPFSSGPRPPNANPS